MVCVSSDPHAPTDTYFACDRVANPCTRLYYGPNDPSVVKHSGTVNVSFTHHGHEDGVCIDSLVAQPYTVYTFQKSVCEYEKTHERTVNICSSYICPSYLPCAGTLVPPRMPQYAYQHVPSKKHEGAQHSKGDLAYYGKKSQQSALPKKKRFVPKFSVY